MAQMVHCLDTDDTPSGSRQGGCFDVIGQHGSALGRSDCPGECEPIGVRRDVVVPEGGAYQVGLPQLRVSIQRFGPTDHSARVELMRRPESLIAIGGQHPVHKETGPHGELASGNRPAERKDKSQRLDRVRGNSREGASLTDRLARASDV